MNDTGPNFEVPCGTCRHLRYNGGGYCYMFREQPPEAKVNRCGQHTGFQYGLNLLRRAVIGIKVIS